MKPEDKIKVEQNLFTQRPSNDLSDIMIEDLAKDYIETAEHMNEKRGSQTAWESIKEYAKRGAFTNEDSVLNLAKALMKSLDSPGTMHKMLVLYRATNEMKPFPYREKLPKKYQIGL